MTKRYHYRYYYKSLFGKNYSDFDADNDDEAELTFWKDKNPELYMVFLIEKSTIDEQADDDADGCDDDRPGGSPNGAENHLANEVLPVRCDVEFSPVVNNALGSRPADGNSGGRGITQRIIDLFKHLFGKQDQSSLVQHSDHLGLNASVFEREPIDAPCEIPDLSRMGADSKEVPDQIDRHVV